MCIRDRSSPVQSRVQSPGFTATQFNTPTLDEFTKLWIALFSRSPKARLAWKTFCDRSIPTYSETRWWSRWEVTKSIHDGFGDVEQFIKETNELAPATLDKLKQILSDPMKNVQLKMELAVVIDAGEPFVKATYTLEGDGPLALCAYEEIRKLYATITTQHFLNTCLLYTSPSPRDATLSRMPSSA